MERLLLGGILIVEGLELGLVLLGVGGVFGEELVVLLFQGLVLVSVELALFLEFADLLDVDRLVGLEGLLEPFQFVFQVLLLVPGIGYFVPALFQQFLPSEFEFFVCPDADTVDLALEFLYLLTHEGVLLLDQGGFLLEGDLLVEVILVELLVLLLPVINFTGQLLFVIAEGETVGLELVFPLLDQLLEVFVLLGDDAVQVLLLLHFFLDLTTLLVDVAVLLLQVVLHAL